MGAKTLLILKPHLDWITRSSVNDFYENMLWILCTLWVFVCNLVLCSVRLLIRHVSRMEVSDGANECTVVKPYEYFQLETNNSENDGIDRFEEKEDDDGHEDDGNIKEEQIRKDFNLLESSSAARANKCQFTSSKGISTFIEEPTWMRFSFQEFYVDQKVAIISDDRNFITGAVEDKDNPKIRSEEAAGDHVQKYDSDQLQTTLNEEFISDDVGSRMKSSLQHTSDPDDLGSKVNSLASEDSISGEHHSFEAEAIVFVNRSLTSDANSESAYPIPCTQGSSDEVDNSDEYEFQSDQIGVAEELGSEEVPSCEAFIPDIKDQNFHDDDDEYISFKPGVVDARMKGKHNVPELPDLYRVISSETDIEEQENPVPDNDFSKPNSDEKGELEDEWEHEDILEQLKLELRNARTGGLPTILEEENEGEEEAESSETPAQVVEVLNTLRTDQKIVYKDRVSEIQIFYKSYAEKMRKLDVLNYQTMHAIGLIQFKDPVRIISVRKAVAPVSKSLVSQNIWPRKAWKNTEDPILKFVGELHRDLELVYVGQVCLSWEILRWQYEKVCELKEHDSQGCHRYNQVAGEFQLFQVLLQRFIENQPFQGPRIRNYVKNRCVISSLLQVPAVKDDNVNDKNMQSGDEEDAISSERLREIIEESMLIFWNFLRADKVTQRNALTDLSDPTLFEIFIGIQTNLQKKERRLRDIARSGNCIVKKFQKHRKGHHDHGQLLAQVQLRLISRVLNMPKLSKDQLIWCRDKLEQTSISSKKIHVEPSFLLFPC